VDSAKTRHVALPFAILLSQTVTAMDLPTQKRLLDYALHLTKARVREDAEPEVPVGPEFEEPAALFVTIRVRHELRGCIGMTRAIYPALRCAQEMVDSALNDPRFPDQRVTPEELDELSLELTVLLPERRIQSPAELRLGTDGILVKARGRQGLFLPQVAIEQGWNAEDFVSYCCSHKLGLPPKIWRDANTELYAIEGRPLHSA